VGGGGGSGRESRASGPFGPQPDIEVERKLLRSHPVAVLLETAESAGAQLVVTGGRRHRLPGVVVGSVARGVLHHATIPVAIFHDHQRGALDREGRSAPATA